ncbi:MAG: tetrahydromethanopterin:alpha-L-glutamate ligase [Methanolobus sp.]|uniref:tetrahydromethanopterin:alpha-L-glutamate ligase n=1 Tax=Methanolobus sp. TaxID=1874737 RepID=UPI00272F7B0F|nr:tetrahydromethanopterin:alpha-L-glutamate ligase [Methanolobus sp.]MDP2217284.1 tetrahydromethanopterin:alpha-L-glutamate ligase [Methanolobus sp.]
MKKLGIAITDADDWTTKAIIDSVRKKGIEPHIFDLRSAEISIDAGMDYKVNGTDLSGLDAIIVRDMGGGKNDAVTFRFDILRQLEKDGLLIANPTSAIQNAANKYHSSYLFSKAGLPAPRTKVVQDTDAAMKILGSFKDALVKPVFGYKGIGIHRIKNMELIKPDGTMDPACPEELVSSLLQEKGMLYIQEFVENSGRDTRAFVVDGKVIGAIYRKAPQGWWLNNLSQGGNAQRCMLTPEQHTICEKAAHAVGAIYAGVDIIEGPTGSILLEINGTPSGAGIYKAWGINVADHIVEAVMRRL